MRGSAFSVVLLLVMAMLVPAGAEEFQSRQTILFNRVHGSIVLIESIDAAGQGAGCSGSVVQSDGSSSIIMTAAHCVVGARRIGVYVHEDVSRSYPARTVAVGKPNGSDVAFVRIGLGGLPALQVASGADVGANVVIIGYPRAALHDFGERHVLVARMDQTTIASVLPRANGYPQTINYQFEATDHGDSGAAVIEIECACVVGVVHGEYDPKVGRSDYAMGPVEIAAVAASGSIALNRRAGFAPKTAPTAVAVVPHAPPPRVVAVEPRAQTDDALATISGPARAQWSGWGAPIELSKIAGMHASLRCLSFGSESLWQSEVINESRQRVNFRYRLTAPGGAARDGMTSHSIDNDGVYLFRPQEVAVACPTGTVYHQVDSVSFIGPDKAPKTEDVSATKGGPTVVFGTWSAWANSSQLKGVRLSFRCVELGDDWYGWEVAFHNTVDHAFSFDFDIEPENYSANLRHRYHLPPTQTFFYSALTAMGTAGSCKKNKVTFYARNISTT